MGYQPCGQKYLPLCTKKGLGLVDTDTNVAVGRGDWIIFFLHTYRHPPPTLNQSGHILLVCGGRGVNGGSGHFDRPLRWTLSVFT